MNKIELLGYIIPDSQLKKGNIVLTNSMICDELSADEAEFEVSYTGSVPYPDFLYSCENDQLFSANGDALCAWNPQSVAIDFDAIPYGTPILYSHNGFNIGRFYVKKVIQIAEHQWRITAQSAMGLLIHQEHNGGIYTIAGNDTIKSIIDEIMSGISVPYTVSQAVANTKVAGRLLVNNARENLRQLCFVYGVSVLKDANGDLLFDYNKPGSPQTILTTDDVYRGNNREFVEPVTRVNVYEHAYFKNYDGERKIVFDNSTDAKSAVNQKIIFNEPIIDEDNVSEGFVAFITTGNITISEHNPNYAIVSGLGTISAVAYTHTIKVLTMDTGVTTAEPKEITIADATLVNTLNSEYCLNRVAAFYSQADEVTCAFVAEDEKAGEMIAYPKPFNTEVKSVGLIKQMNITVSNVLKSDSKFTMNWYPDYLGNKYTHFTIISDDDTWTVPEDVTEIQVILIGGGSGGYDGEDGATASNVYDTYQAHKDESLGSLSGGPTNGGAGGAGGIAGLGGNILNVIMQVTAGTVYVCNIGAGGAKNGGAGGNTTFGTLSSANGEHFDNGFYDVFNDVLLGYNGENGLNGGNGGRPNGTAQVNGDAGIDVPPNVGGAGGNGFYEPNINLDGQKTGWYANGGGGGGGAGFGEDGTAGANTTRIYGYDQQLANGGNGGDGDDGILPTVYGVGGSGGHGGGGGGGSGGYNHHFSGKEERDGTVVFHGNGGVGGSGGSGTAGASGCVIIYW